MLNSIFKLFEHKCVLEVCVHIYPTMIKIHPVFFFFLSLAVSEITPYTLIHYSLH